MPGVKNMAEMVTKQELENAKVDVKDLGLAVNGPADTKVNPRYGEQFWTLATINSLIEGGQLKIEDLGNAIQVALAAGAGAAGWTSDLISYLSGTQTEFNQKIDNQVAGKKIRFVAGAIRNNGTNWIAINDALHNPINFASVEIVDNIYLRIKFAGENTKVIYGSVSCDEAYSRLGLQLGPTVGVNSMDVMGYLPLEFSVKTDGSNAPIINAIPEIKNRITPSRSGAKIRINHTGSVKDFPQVTAVSGSLKASPLEITETAMNILQEIPSVPNFFRVWCEDGLWKLTTNLAGSTLDTSKFTTDGDIFVNLGTPLPGNDFLVQSGIDKYLGSTAKLASQGLSRFSLRFVDPFTNTFIKTIPANGVCDTNVQYGQPAGSFNAATNLPAGTYHVKRGLIPVYWNEITSPTSYGQNGNLWFFAIIEY